MRYWNSVIQGVSIILLLLASANSMAYQPPIDLTVSPPTEDDFIPHAKRVLPSHLTLNKVKLKDVKEEGRGGMVMYKCQIVIEGKTNEPLYIMDGFKDGKYQLKKSSEPGAITTLNAMAIVAPSVGGRPNIRVIVLPNKEGKNENPISKYKKGSYIIISP